MNEPISILYVDDNPLDRELVRDALEKEHGGFRVAEAGSRADFEALLVAGDYDLVLSDFNILGFEGLQVLDIVHAKNPLVPVIIVTGTGSEEVAVEALKGGAADYVIKTPMHIRRLPQIIHAALEKIRMKEERDRLFNYSLDLLCVAGFDGTFKQLNPAWEKTLGWTKDELMSKPHLEFVHPDDRDATIQAARKLVAGEMVFSFDNRYLCKDGTYKWFSWSSYPLVREGLIFAVVRNITERKRAEDELRFHSEIMTNMAEAVYLVRMMDGIIVYSNSTFEKMFGYEQGEMLGMHVSIVNAPTEKTAEETAKNILDSLSEKDFWKGEVKNIRKDGKVFWSYASVTTFEHSKFGRVLLAIHTDITERKGAEEALKENENKYRLLADNVNDVIFVLDMNLNYTYISPSVKTLRGYEPAEVLKLPSFETLTPSSWDLALRTLSEIMALEKSEHREISMSRTLQLEMRRKNGSTVWTEVKFSFIRDEEQRPISILGVTRDITERKRAEENLEHTLDSLRKAFSAIIQVLVSAVETRDPYTAGHQTRSADLARAVATEMGLSREKIEGLRMAGSIHDIGKLSIPAEILSKPTKLSELEFSLIKEHPQKGYEILKNVESPWPLAEMVYQHHERMNGSGYPRGLKGDDIFIEARILAVADVVEAMASYRPYRPALGIEAALEEIEKNKGVLYDPQVVEVCLGLFREKGFSFD